MKKLSFLLVAYSLLCMVSQALATPAAPVMSYDTSGMNLSITWSQVPDATGYRLYYAAYPYTGPTSIGSVDVGNETEAFYTLWEGASYYVAVRAYDETGESRYSNTELFLLGPYTTDHTEGTPELTVETEALEVSTSWTSIPGATGYRLYYAPHPFTDLNTVGSFDMGTSTDADFVLWDGAAFYVAVTSVENGNESGYSNVELLLTGDPIPDWQNEGYVDADDDGYSLDEGDCDDGDATISPLGVEVCGDTIDQDCDGADEICPVGTDDTDDDDDGYTENSGDCDDTDSNIFPNAAEICGDGIDQDCSGADEDCTITSTVAMPTFSPAPGIYSSTQSVSMSTSTVSATIRYTTNGSIPNSSSAVYTSPISVSSDMSIKAKAFKNDWNGSAVATGSYTIISGKGELTFILTWDYQPTAGEGPDVDLHVLAPTGDYIYWDNMIDHMDYDDEGSFYDDPEDDGHGPERIWWISAPNGIYTYYANLYKKGAYTSVSYMIKVYMKPVGQTEQLVATQTGTLSSLSQDSIHYTYMMTNGTGGD